MVRGRPSDFLPRQPARCSSRFPSIRQIAASRFPNTRQNGVKQAIAIASPTRQVQCRSDVFGSGHSVIQNQRKGPREGHSAPVGKATSSRPRTSRIGLSLQSILTTRRRIRDPAKYPPMMHASASRNPVAPHSTWPIRELKFQSTRSCGRRTSGRGIGVGNNQN